MSKGKWIAIGCTGIILLFVLGVLTIFGYIFSDVIIEEIAPLNAKKLPQQNPTTYLFHGELDEVREQVISATQYPDPDSPFPFENASDEGAFRRKADFYLCEAKSEYCLSSNSAKVNEIFQKPENADDIYLASDGSRIFSPVYYAAGTQLEFRTDFHIHLEPADGGKTRITVIPVGPTIYKGYGGVGLHGGILKKAIPVEATTVEEYQLLRYLGFVLGQRDMPKIVLPN